ncbi:MAG TPA: hypothetical protein VG498_05425, partial [Terriglobales bacterium]|nr:hypothetical protein [Terriglobales bacterium]
MRAHKARKRRRLDPDAPLLDFQPEETADEPQVAPSPKKKSLWDDATDSFIAAPSDAEPAYELNHAQLEQNASKIQESIALPNPTQPQEAMQLEIPPHERLPLPPFPRISVPAPKIIEFPRSRHYELAEPVADQLR